MFHNLVFCLLSGTAGIPDAGHCVAIVDDTARLACYDRSYGRDQSPPASGLPPATAAADPAKDPNQQPQADASSEFGLSTYQRQQRRPADEEPQRVRSVVVTTETSRNGRSTFTLENGQRWTQVEATDRPMVRVGQSVEIRRGALGSFLATVPGSGRAAVRVRRLE